MGSQHHPELGSGSMCRDICADARWFVSTIGLLIPVQGCLLCRAGSCADVASSESLAHNRGKALSAVGGHVGVAVFHVVDARLVSSSTKEKTEAQEEEIIPHNTQTVTQNIDFSPPLTLPVQPPHISPLEVPGTGLLSLTLTYP